MALGVFGAKTLVPSAWPPAAHLVLEVGMGATGALGTLALLHRGRLASLRRILRRAPPEAGDMAVSGGPASS